MPARSLLGEREAHGVVLALGEPLAVEQPRRPELVGRREPGGLGEAARDGSQQHFGRSFGWWGHWSLQDEGGGIRDELKPAARFA